mmetsp:Transcript_1061/g.1979  ORF Transcript_1061/g.1979 Transcript_1061/m.1979 type:complete len:226 (+) Transcript_1061:238-915(+)
MSVRAAQGPTGLPAIPTIATRATAMLSGLSQVPGTRCCKAKPSTIPLMRNAVGKITASATTINNGPPCCGRCTSRPTTGKSSRVTAMHETANASKALVSETCAFLLVISMPARPGTPTRKAAPTTRPIALCPHWNSLSNTSALAASNAESMSMRSRQNASAKSQSFLLRRDSPSLSSTCCMPSPVDDDNPAILSSSCLVESRSSKLLGSNTKMQAIITAQKPAMK